MLMTATSPFVILHKSCDDAIIWATRKLAQAGLQAVQTFDLRTARLAHLDCPCPHHGTEQCNCQMVVLLVYQENSQPATIVIHGNDATSWFYLIHSPQQPIEKSLEKNIQEIFRENILEA
ncbi:MAG: hypothetical protein Fur0035_11180 [Anaerolineales bacterium]